VRGAVAARDPGSGAALSIAGVARDDTERREAEARRDLLAREVDHRAKNALAVVQSVLRLTKADDPRGYARAVEGRIAALARAHNLLARNTWAGAGLRAILAQELAPYLAGGDDGATPSGRARLDGRPVTLAPGAAQPVSMALHELATNAAKHGALSVPDGRVAVVWWVEPAGGALRLRWTERGGPEVEGLSVVRCFGTAGAMS
jgi:two-component sensor histidine kinase